MKYQIMLFVARLWFALTWVRCALARTLVLGLRYDVYGTQNVRAMTALASQVASAANDCGRRDLRLAGGSYSIKKAQGSGRRGLVRVRLLASMLHNRGWVAQGLPRWSDERARWGYE